MLGNLRREEGEDEEDEDALVARGFAGTGANLLGNVIGGQIAPAILSEIESILKRYDLILLFDTILLLKFLAFCRDDLNELD